jgi:glutamine cyclotransferase
VFPDDIFLEGSAFFPLNNIIYILTWKENVVIRINPENFE